jgi:hypothetical protein
MGWNREQPVPLAKLDDVARVLGFLEPAGQQFAASPLDLVLVQIPHRIAQPIRRAPGSWLQPVVRQLLEDSRMVGVALVQIGPAQRMRVFTLH